MRLRVLPLLAIAAALALANALILVGALPLWLRAGGALALAIALPGLLLALLLAGEPETAEGWLERSVAGLAAGYGVIIVLMLLLSYLPGGIARVQILGSLNVLVVLLGLALSTGVARTGAEEPGGKPFPWWQLATVLAVGALLRLSWLGYSEFQGDEARVLLRAGDILRGFENALFIHHKAPGELLISAALYGLTQSTTEAVARSPFALASLGGLAAVFLLGRRLLGATAGWVAALLLAVDGYLIAFGRIVQYQSVIVLASAVALLLLHQAWRSPQRLRGRVLLAGWVAAAGLLAHYEAVGIALPAIYLLVQIGRRSGWKSLLRALVPAALVAGAAVSLFFVPYLRYPGLSTAYNYVVNERLGMHFPYNHLVDFLQRTMLYSSSYSVMVLAALTLVAFFLAYRRQFGSTAGAVASAAMAALFAVALVSPGWFTIGPRDISGLLVALPLIVLCVLPALAVNERTVWIWFASLSIGALFFVGKPASHVYVFFTPWSLLAGAGAQALLKAAGRGPRPVLRLAQAGAMALFVLLAVYPWLMFADAPAERLRRWADAQPRAYWYPFDQPTDLAILGFPLRNGWKVAGALYASGELSGSFETNARPEVADWYTRGLGACPHPQTLFFLADTVEPTDDAQLERVRQEVEQGYHQTGSAVVGGAERLRIYTRGGEGAPALFAIEGFAPVFDGLTAEPMHSRRGRVLGAAPAQVSNALFGDAIRLRGFTVAGSTTAPGGIVELTLVWESERPLPLSYTIFLHVVDPATNGKAGQTDALPVCGQNLTNLWNPGDLVEDPQRIQIVPDAAPGRYRIYAGLYDVETGERLPVAGAEGEPLGDYVDLGEIVVAAPP